MIRIMKVTKKWVCALALLVVLPVARAEASVQEVVVTPADDGRALVNPGMGWVMHYYDNGSRYGTTIATGDDLRWFPGCTVVYLRLPWAHLEPEEGKYNWNSIDTPAQQWISRGGQIAFRITCSETMKEATPEWGDGALEASSYDMEKILFGAEHGNGAR